MKNFLLGNNSNSSNTKFEEKIVLHLFLWNIIFHESITFEKKL